MVDAREVFLEAQAGYQSALAVAMDTESNVDGTLALRREGRGYAQALTVYTLPTMDWLAFVDAELHPKKGGGVTLSE